MAESIHALAPHHLPRFIPGPDGGDPLMVAVVGLLILLLLAVGNFYLKLHAYPEHMAHRQNNTQMQLVAILALLALLTHNNVFWVGALLLAAVRLPDFSSPLNSMASSLERLAGAEEEEDEKAGAPVADHGASPPLRSDSEEG